LCFHVFVALLEAEVSWLDFAGVVTVWPLCFFFVRYLFVDLLKVCFVFFVIRVKVWSEHVEGVFGGGKQKRSILRMESQLLHVLLALMEEHELWRNIHAICVELSVLLLKLSVVSFNREVPKCELIVR